MYAKQAAPGNYPTVSTLSVTRDSMSLPAETLGKSIARGYSREPPVLDTSRSRLRNSKIREVSMRAQGGSPPIVSLDFHPFDVRSQATKFFIDQFVATIDMVDAVDFGLTFRL